MGIIRENKEEITRDNDGDSVVKHMLSQNISLPNKTQRSLRVCDLQAFSMLQMVLCDNPARKQSPRPPGWLSSLPRLTVRWRGGSFFRPHHFGRLTV